MITFAQELLCEVVQEVQPLLQAHYEALTIRKDVVKLDPQWEMYRHLEALGAFVVFTARDDGILIGYNAFFVNRHMHYAGFTVAQNDVFYIREDYQRGMTALRFLRHSERALKALGAQKAIYHAKLSNNFAPILHRLEYADEEVMCGKFL